MRGASEYEPAFADRDIIALVGFYVLWACWDDHHGGEPRLTS